MKVTGIMTDNGSCYRARAFATACKRLGLKHIFTRPTGRKKTAGRALHPNGATLVGLCSRLRNLRPARQSPANLAS